MHYFWILQLSFCKIWKNPSRLYQKIYKAIFWLGYLTVIITAFLPIAGDLTRIKLGWKDLQIRLDHLLHIAAYFLICMYYLFGQRKGLILFKSHSLLKFILLIFLLATVTEVVQLWVPGRAFNPADLLANVTGLGFGVTVVLIGDRRRKLIEDRRRKKEDRKKLFIFWLSYLIVLITAFIPVISQSFS